MDNSFLRDELYQKLKLIKTSQAQNEFIQETALHPERIPLLLEIIRTDPGTVKFFLSKAIKILCETDPDLIYPYFAEIGQLTGSSNNIIKWGAIIALSDLVRIDDDQKFKLMFQDYLDLMNSDSMITAANAAGNAWKIIEKFPDLENEITRRMLKITDNTFYHKGEPSPECRNVLIGHIIECFGRYFDRSENQSLILDFVRVQTENSRASVARQARKFLKKYDD